MVLPHVPETLTAAARTLEECPLRRSPRPSCSAPSPSARPTACSTSTRRRAAGSARSPRASGGRRAGSAGGSSRSRTSSSRSTAAAAARTVTGASLVRSHDRIRSDGYRLQVGLVGLEAMLRLFTEEEQNDRAFLALTRFLDALDQREPQPGRRPALDPLALSFQLKLLWLSGFLPHLETCVECGAADDLVAFLPSAGGAVCAACDRGGLGLSPGQARRPRAARHAIADATAIALGDRAARDVLAVVPLVRAPRRLPPPHAECLARPEAAAHDDARRRTADDLAEPRSLVEAPRAEEHEVVGAAILLVHRIRLEERTPLARAKSIPARRSRCGAPGRDARDRRTCRRSTTRPRRRPASSPASAGASRSRHAARG